MSHRAHLDGGRSRSRNFTLLFKSSREFFFAPVIEYGPLAAWKEIAGSGQEMQDVFWYIKEAIDAYFDGRPFQVNVKAGCIIGKKLEDLRPTDRDVPIDIELEEIPLDDDEVDTDLPRPPHQIASGSVRLQDVGDLQVEEISSGDADVVMDNESIEEQELDAFIEGKRRPSHLDENRTPRQDLAGQLRGCAAFVGQRCLAGMGDPRKDYLALVDELTEHDRRYYVEAKPTISDVEYDKLLVKLRKLEAEHRDWIVQWSPTQRVGHAPVSDFPKVERPVAMLSLDNTYDEAELRAFYDRVIKGLDGDVPVFSIEPKIDGFGIELTHANGAQPAFSSARLPRGRTHRRGRHGERAHGEGCRVAVARADRHHGARRDLHDEGRVRGDQCGAREGRRRAVQESAQHGGRLDQAAGSPRGREAADARDLVRGRGGRDLRRGSPRVARAHQAARDSGLELQHVSQDVGDARLRGRELASSPRRSRIRGRRPGRQGRRFRPARRARHDREVSAVGDRVQVSGAPGHDDPARPRDQRRPHRRGDPGRDPRSGRCLGHHGVARVGPQLGSGRAARARQGRSRHDPEGRRDHSGDPERHRAVEGQALHRRRPTARSASPSSSAKTVAWC